MVWIICRESLISQEHERWLSFSPNCCQNGHTNLELLKRAVNWNVLSKTTELLSKVNSVLSTILIAKAISTDSITYQVSSLMEFREKKRVYYSKLHRKS